MTKSNNGLEGVQKKLELLDNEVNTFVHAVNEVRGMKDSVSELHETLMNRDSEVERQKKELELLLSSTNSLVSSIEEQTKNMKDEMDQKADEFINSIKSGISQIGSICEEGRGKLKNQHDENIQQLSVQFDELRALCTFLKTIVDTHDEKMNSLKTSYASASSFYEKVEASLGEMKRTVYEFQKRPYELENRMKKMEDRLELLIEERYGKQKNHIFILMIIVIATALFSVGAFYLR
jgi:chromosome segregation ATPase